MIIVILVSLSAIYVMGEIHIKANEKYSLQRCFHIGISLHLKDYRSFLVLSSKKIRHKERLKTETESTNREAVFIEN